MNIKPSIKLNNQLAENMKCTELWKAVILQAILDIKNNGNKVMDRVNRAKAILWINPNKKDFINACQMAEINPQRVYEYKLKLLKQQEIQK